MLHSYRNQSFDLHCKLNDWFLMKSNIGLKLDKGPFKKDLTCDEGKGWQKRHGGGGCSRNSDVKTIILDLFYLLMLYA